MHNVSPESYIKPAQNKYYHTGHANTANDKHDKTVMDCSVYSTHLDFGGILFSTNHKSAPIAAKRLGKRMSSHSGPGRQTYFSAF